MKTKLLKKWNFLMRYSFLELFCYCHDLSAIDRVKRLMIKLALRSMFDKQTRDAVLDAFLELDDYRYAFSSLDFEVAAGVMTHYLSKNNIKMKCGDRKNVWDEFSYKWRRYSRKWNLPSEKLKRAIASGER